MTFKIVKIENPDDEEYTEAELKQIQDEYFIEQVFEIAFGDDAIDRNFTYDEVIEKLKEFSDNSLIIEREKN
tara:strand:- start:71 stop:286 length:216 start_codon:yes stop_codon:yes gene_type:complete